MKRLALLAAVAMLQAGAAHAQATWSQIMVATSPSKVATVVAAADELMSSPVGKKFTGRMMLQVHAADGMNPATHSFVPIYRSTAQREAFVRELQASQEWAKFLGVMEQSGQAVGTVLYNTVTSWGDYNETDKVWIGHAFTVRDPAAFLAAFNQLRNSETGKKFPGQVYLSAVVAGGISPVTHTISVGYASEVEMDAWVRERNASQDWATYIASSRAVSDYLGASLLHNVKNWGPAKMKDLAVR